MRKKYDQILRKQAEINHNLITFGFKFCKKIKGKNASQQKSDFYLLRDNLQYRLNCIVFHLQIVFVLKEKAMNEYPTGDNGHDQLPYLLSIMGQQLAAFDSLVFHSCSLFDYTSNLIGFICTKQLKNQKWNTTHSHALEKGHVIHSSPVGKIVVSLHKDYIDKLYEYRSNLIHERMDVNSVETSLDFRTHEESFEIYAPKKVIQAIHHLRTSSRINRLTMTEVSFWIVNKVFDSFTQLLAGLDEHIDAGTNGV